MDNFSTEISHDDLKSHLRNALHNQYLHQMLSDRYGGVHGNNQRILKGDIRSEREHQALYHFNAATSYNNEIGHMSTKLNNHEPETYFDTFNKLDDLAHHSASKKLNEPV